MAPREDVRSAEASALGKTKSKPFKLQYTEGQVYAHVSKFAKADNLRAFAWFIPTALAYAACYWLPIWILPIHALLSMRFFICMHDMAHGSFFSKNWLNYGIGLFVGAFTLAPYTYWQNGHNYHHEHSNDLDYQQGSQTAPYTVKEYKEFPAWQRTAYRIVTIPAIMIGGLAPFAMAVLQPLSCTVTFEWIIQLLTWSFMYHHGVLLRQFLVVGTAASLGVFLFHLQHTYEETRRERGRNYFENGYYGSSFLEVPWFLRWATANIEVHHIHHLNARVPLYKLRECHAAAPPGMFGGIKHIGFAEGWKALGYVLYDEDKDRLVTFEEVHADLEVEEKEQQQQQTMQKNAKKIK